MSRTSRRRAIRAVAPVVGLLAAGLLVWQGSTAAFSATTPNTGDVWATGSLSLTNNGGGALYAASTSGLFNDSGLRVGDTGTKCITVKNTGSIAGALRVYRSGVITGTNSANLAPVIGLTIQAAPLLTADPDVTAACAAFPTTSTTLVTNTGLSALPIDYASSTGVTAAAGGRVAFKISYTVNTTGTTVGDNALQSSSATGAFTWEIQ
jgi:hypothetical protein